ncbi:MAG: hypothetical protein D6725_12720 [Planctomycetota bacterium]|nr:MAG: hypothetical protein D6725_12720 [Planctomycetota bacterium]
MKSTAIAIVILSAVGPVSNALGQSDRSSAPPAPAELIRRFAEGWDESLWQQKFRGGAGYMRAANDSGWQLRMRVLQQLVIHGPDSIPVLLKVLKSGSAPERILAAQTLGFLGPRVPGEPLLEAAQSDADPAVRLYAVDALGMTGRTEKVVDWKTLRQSERNRDVRRHIDYTIERAGRALDPAVVRTLTQWDANTIDSAKLGKPAPDFTLTAATGETIRLSDFRGKKSVVLVFIYGDT